MKQTSYLLSTTPPQQTVGIARRITPFHRFRRKFPCENHLQKSTGKELDRETGLYYFGARYLDPRTSRWLSVDPAIWQGDFLPSAPNSEQARRRNANLPNGGVFNPINLHVFNYANNNPVRYVDPDGRIPQKWPQVVEVVFNKAFDAIYAFGVAVFFAWQARRAGQAYMAAGSANVGSEQGQGLRDRAQAAAPAPVQPPENDNNRRDGYREKTRDANANDRRQIDSVAREANIDRREFGNFIEETKRIEGRGPSDNFSYSELRELAREFKELR